MLPIIHAECLGTIFKEQFFSTMINILLLSLPLRIWYKFNGFHECAQYSKLVAKKITSKFPNYAHVIKQVYEKYMTEKPVSEELTSQRVKALNFQKREKVST